MDATKMIKIRDINSDDDKELSFKRGISVLNDDGEELFSIRFKESGGIEVSSGMTTKYRGVVLNTELGIIPKSSNVVIIYRTKN